MYDWLIIDGNNLLHSDPALGRMRRQDFAQARQVLIDKLDDAASRLANHVVVVFDGTIGGKGTDFRSSLVEILFSSADTSADTVIERMVQEHARTQKVTVVTSDLAERHTVEGAGADALSCRLFLDELEDLRESRDRDITTSTMRKRPPNLGELFPDL
jgi:predicted RNA-binding protein with PIN domain